MSTGEAIGHSTQEEPSVKPGSLTPEPEFSARWMLMLAVLIVPPAAPSLLESHRLQGLPGWGSWACVLTSALPLLQGLSG